MEGIDELLKYVGNNFDKPLLKVIYFMEQAKLLEANMKVDRIKEGDQVVEKPSNCMLETGYLRLCNTDFENKNLMGEIFLQYLDFVLVESRSFWRFNIYNLEKEFAAKCSYCNIPLKYCPMKVLAYIKKCIADDNIDSKLFFDKLAGKDINYIKDPKIITEIAIGVSSVVKDMLDLKGAEFLLDTEVIDIIDEKNNKVKYKYLDFNVKETSFINELNEYFSTTEGLYGELDLNNLNIKENFSYMFNQSPIEIAVYIKHLCENVGIDYKDVFNAIYNKFDINQEKIAKMAYYKEYLTKVDNFDGAENLKQDLKEIFTYIKNYSENPNLPYIQFNLLLGTENTKTINDTVNALNRFCRMNHYLSNKNVLFVDAEMFIKTTKDNTDVFIQVDKLYNENDFIVFTNVHRIKYLNEFRVDSLFIAIGKYYNKNPRSMTILSGEQSVVYELVKKYDKLMDHVFLHKLDIEGYELDLVKSKVIKDIKKAFSIDEECKKDIEKYIEATYQKGKENEIDYINKIVNEVVFSKYKTLDTNSITKFNLENKKEDGLKKALDDLNKLTGLVEVKHKVNEIIKYIEFNKKIGDSKALNLNMMFKGNAGTGKTTVARIIGEILYNLGIVRTNKFVEVTSKDLIGDHLGQTSPKTQRAIDSALDGVLFIDEAYSIMSSKGTADYPTECISTLCKAMEKNRDRLVVIFAGYTKEMNLFVNKNQGLMSRIGHVIEFEDFSKEELLDIFKNKVKENKFELEEGIEAKVLSSISKNKLMRNFGNARFIDNMYEKLLLTHSLNFENETDLRRFTCKDFDIMEQTVKADERTIDDILSDLNSLTGLKEIKEVLEGFVSTLEFNKKVNMQNEFNMHMIFKGNAGTGKTTVARLLAEIYYNLGYIKKNKLVEVQSQDLIGEYVGQTGPKTQNVIESAVDGVLFIDEAYAIMQHRGTGVSYTDECIATLLKAMEDYNGRLIIIFAGYTNEMIEFRDLNPGLKSRVGFELNFEDYSVEELLEIFVKKSTDRGFKVTEAAIEKVRKILEKAKEVENFGNGRYINNMIQKIIVEHAIKTRGIDDETRLLTIEEEDINLEKLQPELSKRKIGF